MIGEYHKNLTKVYYNNGLRIMEGLIVADDDYHIVVDFKFTLERYSKNKVYEIDDKYWLVV